jgi:hypothetical protein
MNVIESLHDRAVLGMPPFEDLAPWRRWLVFLKATYGLEIDADERAIFEHHTAREYDPPPGGYPVVVAIVGRQSGKSRIGAVVVDFEAVRSLRERDGTELYALLVAQDHRAALRTAFSYVAAPFAHQELLRRAVRNRTAEALSLDNGITIAGYPCRPSAVRGLRARVVLLDELAYFRNSENLPVDVEMIRACRPTLATTGGKLIILSSPYWQTGALWELHKSHFGRNDSQTLVWVGTAPEMNPTLPADYLQRLQEDDPEAFRSEVLAEFRAGVSAFFDPDALQACVADWRELEPTPEQIFFAFCDPSGGRQDAFTVAIGHRDGNLAVVDCLRAWSAPFDPAAVIAEAAGILKTYRVRSVVGDRYAGSFPAEAFRSHGVRYEPAALDRSALYLEMLPRVNAGTVVLPNDPKLLRELRGLERRRGASGRDRVDHSARVGAHDDRANSCAGLVYQLQGIGARGGFTVRPLVI